MANQTIKAIDAEFDETFLSRPYEEGIVYASGEEIKQFLHKSIKQAITQQKNEIIGILEGMKKYDLVGIKNGEYIGIKDAEIGAYNHALNQAIQRIKENSHE